MTNIATLNRRSPTATKWAIAGVVALALLVYCIVSPPWVVKSLKSEAGASGVAGSTNFHPDKYVASIWSTKLIPAVRSSSVELSTLLPELKKERAATIKRYGHYASTGGSPAFLVKGEGRVVSIDTASLVSTARVALGAGSKPDVLIQIGPILTGTDVRDALRFIDFNQFVNQVQYEEVSISINSRIRESVLPKLSTKAIKGKRLEFSGAFTLGAATDPVTITPVIVKVGA